MSSTYSAAFQDLLDSPYDSNENVLIEKLGHALAHTTPSLHRNASGKRERDFRYLMRFLTVSGKARAYVTASGTVMQLTESVQNLSGHLMPKTFAPLKVLVLTEDEKKALMDWLHLLTQTMMENTEAKVQCAKMGIALTVARLWKTAMVKEERELREALLQFLLTFTASCNEACASMTETIRGEDF